MPRILYLQYTNPAGYPPLLHSASMLAEQGWEVLFLGIRSRGSESLTISPQTGIRYQQIGGRSGGRLGSVKYASFALRALLHAKRFRPDWCYASDPYSAPAALAIARVLRTRVLYHEHDAPAATVRGRAKLIRAADIVVAPSAARLQLLPPGKGQRFVVWNCPRTRAVGPEPVLRNDQPFRIVYHGSLSRERLTPQFVDALALLPPHVELHIFGYETQGHRGYTAELLTRAAATGVSSRVRYHGAFAHADLLRRLRGYDLGISTIVSGASDQNLNTLVGASNKSFEYLAAGIPLLVGQHAEWREVFVQPGYAVDCVATDPQSIAAAVNSLVTARDRAHQMGLAGRARVLSEWNYEAQFRPVLAALRT